MNKAEQVSRTRRAGSGGRDSGRPAARQRAEELRRTVKAKGGGTTRDAILAAALDEFATHGFAATRLDDVAGRAGVAKGTIYVHFRDKESLFEELVRTSLSPLIASLEGAPLRELTLRSFAEQLASIFVNEIFATRRKDVLRLIIAEGQRFPQLAHIYYREVVKRAMAVVRSLARQARERGEIRSNALERFPQLLVSPAIMAIIWDALFSRFEPIEVAGLMQQHVALLLKALEEPSG